MLKDENSRRKIRNFCFLGLGVSVAYVVNYVNRTKNLLNHAFDFSVLEIFDDNQQSNYKYTQWITPSYNEAKSIFHECANFIRFTYAKRLVNVAKCDNQILRVRAIRHLTKLKLDDWQYSIIAHMCDARMAVAIARSATSVEHSRRYFLAPPRNYCTYNNQLLLHTVKDYMNLLYKDTKKEPHGCLQKTVSKIFLQAYDINRIIDCDHGVEALSYVGKETDDVLPLCLETVRHHSGIQKWCKDIPNHMGLYLLMEVHQRHPNDLNFDIPLCQIITNLSIYPDLLQELFKSGWIAALAEWTHHPDVRISSCAGQALANLDKDTIEEMYSPNLFLLHPRGRSEEKVLVDVIFVHGLLGSVFYTWRNGVNCPETLDLVGKSKKLSESIGLEDTKLEDNLLTASSDPAIHEYLQEMAENEKLEWDSLGENYEIIQYDIPEFTNGQDPARENYMISLKDSVQCHDKTQCWARDWLPRDCSHLRVLGVNYSTSLSLWAQMCPEISNNTTLEERSVELMSELTKAGVGQRPIVWVGHSMGGLLVKNVITEALKSDDPMIRDIANQSRAIFFYSTPHTGSKTAMLNQTTSYLVWPSMDVQELREGSANLHRIHNEFLAYLDKLPIKIFSFVESKPTIISALKLNIEIVEKKSGNPGVGEYYEIPLNHLGICKPTNKHSFLYRKVVEEISKIINLERKLSNEMGDH